MNKTVRNEARPSLTLRRMPRISDDPATLVEIQRYRPQIDFLNFSKFPSGISHRGKWDREKAKERRQTRRTKEEGRVWNSVRYQLVAKLSSDIRVKLTGWIPIYLDRCVTSNVTGWTEVEHFHKEKIGGPRQIAEPISIDRIAPGHPNQPIPVLIHSRNLRLRRLSAKV